MLNIGISEAIKYGFGAIVLVAVVYVLIWAYRAARKEGAAATEKKEDKKRAGIFKGLVDNITTGRPHGTDTIRVRKPGKWTDIL